ncbi:hypothetical protein STEG23_025122, partial [Scotinomys teguina]
MIDSGSIIAFRCVPTDDSVTLQWTIPTQLSNSQLWKLNESQIKTKNKDFADSVSQLVTQKFRELTVGLTSVYARHKTLAGIVMTK